ncbi:hypothetical protein LTS18_012193, partial [Coniosporium uncinatum]
MDTEIRNALQSAIKDAFFSTSFPSQPQDQGFHVSGEVKQKDGQDPRVRKLIEGVLFSRNFVITYQYVLVALLGLFTIVYWSEKYLASRRRRFGSEVLVKEDGEILQRGDDVQEEVTDSSESSSTLEGSVTPPDAAKYKSSDTEVTPLLAKNTSTTPKAFNPTHAIRSWL